MSTPHPRVLIIGAGPSGLAASASLAALGIPTRVVDRHGLVGGAYAQMDPDIVLSSPSRFIHLPRLPHNHGGAYISAGRVHRYLRRYAEELEIAVETASVASVRPVPARDDALEVCFEGGEVGCYDAVIAATGMFEHPRSFHAPGLDTSPLEVEQARDWRGVEPGSRARILVVGGATAAVEIAESCGRAGVPVTLSARSGVKVTRQRLFGRDLHDYFYPLLKRLPRALARSYCEKAPTQPGIDLGFGAFRKAGLVAVRGAIERFEGRRVHFSSGPPAEFDRVIAAIGYDFAMPYLPDSASRAEGGHVQARENAVVGVPGLFVLGTPCAHGVLSEFFAGITQDAPRVAKHVEAWLAGRAPRVARRVWSVKR